jgi:BMFP domain-containing protein YqiC
MNSISWASETQSNPMETNPRAAFERMFGRSSTQAERLQRIQEDRSILDSVTEEARDLQRKVGARDRARLGDYLDNVREIERRIQRTEAQNSKKVIALDAPLGVPDNFVDHANLLFDLLAVAYKSDLTRVFSFMMSREASQRTYPELNIPGTHHDVSHHGGRPENMENHAKINLHYAQLFARFVEKLKAMPEGDGTVLDNSLVFYGAGMSDGQAHAPYPLPLVAVGSAGGKVKGDRHIVAPDWTPVANLWLQVADVYGTHLDSFAESTGRVEL